MWTFDEAQNYLENTAPPGKSIYGLDRINLLLDLLDHPENKFTRVSIAGTNGKGSTLAFLDSLLRAHRITVACHVKPHLESVTERIRLHGFDSSEDEFARALFEVKSAVDSGWTRDDSPTYFELIFAAFLCAARNSAVQVVLIEAGLGGRLDAVNGIDADLVVLTSVDFDHTELLGDTLEEITMEKIVIARPGSVVVCQQNPPSVILTVRKFCDENKIRLSFNDDHTFTDGMTLGLPGPYQQMNACLAILAMESLAEIKPDLFRYGSSYKFFEQGLRDARLPGRWENITGVNGDGQYILDGGHNTAGLSAVLNQYKIIADGNGTIIFGMKKSKDLDKILPMLINSGSNIIFTKIPWPEGHDPEKMTAESTRLAEQSGILSQIKFYTSDSIKKGIEIADIISDDTVPVLITGSLYLVGDARSELLGKN